MTHLNGPEAIGRVRDQNKTIPIYMLCLGDKYVEAEALEAGATGYIHLLDPECWEKVDVVLNTYLR